MFEDVPKRQSVPISAASLLSGMLARYGIAPQVLAARVVARANELLLELIGSEQIEDAKVLSFVDHVLVVACRHPAARFALGVHGDDLARKLEQVFPDIQIHTVRFDLKPDEWSKREAWR